MAGRCLRELVHKRRTRHFPNWPISPTALHGCRQMTGGRWLGCAKAGCFASWARFNTTQHMGNFPCAGAGEDRRQMAGRCLGELVRKMGDRILSQIVPILKQGMSAAEASTRQVGRPRLSSPNSSSLLFWGLCVPFQFTSTGWRRRHRRASRSRACPFFGGFLPCFPEKAPGYAFFYGLGSFLPACRRWGHPRASWAGGAFFAPCFFLSSCGLWRPHSSLANEPTTRFCVRRACATA
jgi:hypothetical protein